jgi:hypothetical protein
MSVTLSLLLVSLAACRSLAQTVAVSVVPWCNHSIRVRMYPGNASTSPGAHVVLRLCAAMQLCTVCDHRCLRACVCMQVVRTALSVVCAYVAHAQPLAQSGS